MILYHGLLCLGLIQGNQNILLRVYYRKKLALLVSVAIIELSQRVEIRIFDSICHSSDSKQGQLDAWLYRNLDSKQGHLNDLDLFQGSGGVPLSFMLRAIFPI